MILIATFDLYMVSSLESELYTDLPEPDPYNINLEACGIETKLFISNIGSVLRTAVANGAGSLLSLTSAKSNRIGSHFGSRVYWQGIIRLFMAMY